MCICVNCKFYSSCWINNALINFPANYKVLKKNKRIKNLPTFLIVQLNVNIRNIKPEPDITFCDAFIEKPGSWLL